MSAEINVSISELITVPLKKSGHYLIGPCPMCGGEDRFNVKDDRLWMCRHCSPNGKYSDAIGLVKALHNVDYPTALRILGADNQQYQQQRRVDLNRVPGKSTPRLQVTENAGAWKTPAWQLGANSLLDRAIPALRPDTNAWRYLTESRGLHHAVILRHQLGYLDSDCEMMWGESRVFAYRGIVIPWEQPQDAESYYRLNIRLSPDDQRGKYKQVAGGTNHGMYIASRVNAGEPAIIVEGEFDALLLKSELTRWAERTRRRVPPLGIVATGATGASRIMQWVMMLRRASVVLVAFDDDANQAGERGARFWLDNLPHAKRVIPTHHDITDMWRAGLDVVRWVREAI
jgi:hypothetical protein